MFDPSVSVPKDRIAPIGMSSIQLSGKNYYGFIENYPRRDGTKHTRLRLYNMGDKDPNENTLATAQKISQIMQTVGLSQNPNDSYPFAPLAIYDHVLGGVEGRPLVAGDFAPLLTYGVVSSLKQQLESATELGFKVKAEILQEISTNSEVEEI